MLLCILAGLVLGAVFGVLMLPIPASWLPFACVLILATVLALIGGTRAYLARNFHGANFCIGYAGNLILAFGISLLGQILEIPLYYAAIFYFVLRIFQNFSFLKRFCLNKWRKSDMI